MQHGGTLHPIVSRALELGGDELGGISIGAMMVLASHDFVLIGYEKDLSVTPEGKIKTKFSARLRKLNHLWKFMPVQQGYGLPALDYLLCVNGHFVAVETKVPGKHPTPRQEVTIAAIRDAGGLVFVVDTDESMDACIGALVLLSHGPPVSECVHT